MLNKTPRLSSARMFVRLYRLLLIHYIYIYIYVSVTKPTCPAFSAWMNTGAIRSMKVTGKAIMLCSYGININVMANLMLVQCVIASHAEVWTCQFWWKFYQELSVTMVQVPEGTAVSKVSNGAKIRNRYNQVPHLTQDTNGKVTNSQKTPQTRAKRSALSQQVTTKHI